MDAQKKSVAVGHPPHAVFLPYPVQGHINPMLQLAKLLNALHGFHISFVNNHHNHRRLLRSHGPTGLFDLPSFRFHAISDGLPPAGNPDAAQHIPSLSASVEKNCPAHFRELLLRLRREGDAPPVSCVVSDTGMPFAVEIAAEFGVQATQFWTASAGGLLGMAQFNKLIDMGIVPLPDSSCLTNGYLDKVVDFVPSMEGITLKHLPNLMRTTDPDEPMIHLIIRRIQGLSSAHCPLIINTFDALDHHTVQTLAATTILHSPILTVGPLSLLANNLCDERHLSIQANLMSEDQSFISWLDTKPRDSVMYVNFGSIVTLTQEEITHFALGLVNSQQSFLWIVRPDLVVGGDSNAAIEVKRLVDETNGRGMLASWCNQRQVLGHQAVGGFLTHCGWNSVIEALGFGVPLICWPSFAEQMTNCWFCCEKWKIGVEIGGDGGGEARTEEVARVVREVIEGEKGEEMRLRAREWKKLGEDATTIPIGPSYLNIDKLVSHLTCVDGSVK